jgi:hypothetical protein
MAEKNTILACVFSRKDLRARTQYVIEPQVFSWGETIKVPGWWGLRRTVEKIGKNRSELWHRQYCFEYNASDWNWFATIEASGETGTVIVKYVPETISSQEASFLEIEEEENGTKYLQIPANIS